MAIPLKRLVPVYLPRGMVVIMKYKIVIVIFLLSVLDGFIFVYYSVTPQFFQGILLLHLILYAVICILSNKFPRKDYGVPVYLALLLPGLGGLVVASLFFSLSYFLHDSIILGDYERYIRHEQYLDSQENLDYEKEMRTLSFLDQINLLDVKSKKQLIVDLSTQEYQGKEKILQKGLEDTDKEVKYYSAVTLNLLDADYTRIIDRLREEFNLHQDTDALKGLAKAYQSYLNSGLLAGELLQVFNKEYIDVLHKLIDRGKETPEILDELVKAYLRSENFERAETVNTRLLQTYPDRFEGILNQAKIFYEQRLFSKLSQLLQGVKSKHAKIPAQLNALVSFWVKSEEI